MDQGAEEARLGAGRPIRGGSNSLGASRPWQRLKRGPVATSLTWSTLEVFKVSALKTWGKNKYLRTGIKK